MTEFKSSQGNTFLPVGIRILGGMYILFGLAKILLQDPRVPLLRVHDPVLGLPFSVLLKVAGVTEFAIGAFSAVAPRSRNSANLLAGLTLSIAVYRVAAKFSANAPCPCLGTLPEILGLSPNLGGHVALGGLVAATVLLAWEYAMQFLIGRRRGNVA